MTAIGIHSHPTKKLGRRARVNRPAIQLSDHLTGVALTAPIVDTPPNLTFPMDLNDTIGDCVVAGSDHALQVIYSALTGSYINWTADKIVAYYKTQNPNFDLHASPNANGPGSPSDGGMIIQTFLEYLVKQGVILGFASVNHTKPAEMELATYLGLAIVTGEALTVAQQSQRVWDIVSGDAEWGGHCTCTVGYSDARKTCVTWGEELDMTPRFEVGTNAAGVGEAWFIITQAHIDHPAFRQGVNLDSFGAAYTQLTGRPFVWAPSPSPAPTPSPVTTTADQQLAAVANPWVQSRHTGQNHIMANALRAWLASKSL